MAAWRSRRSGLEGRSGGARIPRAGIARAARVRDRLAVAALPLLVRGNHSERGYRFGILPCLPAPTIAWRFGPFAAGVAAALEMRRLDTRPEALARR